MQPDPRPVPAPEAPSDPEAVRRATRLVMWFSGLLLAALWFSASSPPWPMPLLTGVVAVVAIVIGIRAIIAMRRAKMGGAMLVLLVVGLLLAGALVFFSVVQAAMWPVYADLQDCLDRAITSRAERACVADLETNVQDWFWGLMGS